MVNVNFYETVNDPLFKFAVIIAKTGGKWVLCKHRARTTYEFPGGHREPGERILDTAKRELYEETGATAFEITPVCAYSVTDGDPLNAREIFGMLYYADIKTFEAELHSEIESILITEHLADHWTYPLIQPELLAEAKRRGYL